MLRQLVRRSAGRHGEGALISWWNNRTSRRRCARRVRLSRRHSGPSVLLHARVASILVRNGAVSRRIPFGEVATVQNRSQRAVGRPVGTGE